MNYQDWTEPEIHERACRVYGYIREVAPDLPLKQDAVISDTMICDAYDLYETDYEQMAVVVRAVHEGRYRNVDHEHIGAMMDYVDGHQPCSYAQLLRYAHDEHTDWFQDLTVGRVGVVMKEYCRESRDAVRASDAKA